MKTLKINQQKPTLPLWKDEAGFEIPVKRISPSEKRRERSLADIARKAVNLNTALTEFKTYLETTVDALYLDFLAENNGKIGKNKGNVTLFNFDRSIKVVVKMQDRIDMDTNFINLAKAELDEMIATFAVDAQDAIRTILQTAFETSGGNLDYKKVLSLKKHSERFNNVYWDNAMKYIDKAISKPSSKEYQQVWIKDNKGEYQNIQLNFAAIESIN